MKQLLRYRYAVGESVTFRQTTYLMLELRPPGGPPLCTTSRVVQTLHQHVLAPSPTEAEPGWCILLETTVEEREGNLTEPYQNSRQELRLGPRGELWELQGSSVRVGPSLPVEAVQTGAAWEGAGQLFRLEKLAEEDGDCQATMVGVSRLTGQDPGGAFTVESESLTLMSVTRGRQLQAQTHQTKVWENGQRLATVTELELLP